MPKLGSAQLGKFQLELITTKVCRLACLNILSLKTAFLCYEKLCMYKLNDCKNVCLPIRLYHFGPTNCLQLFSIVLLKYGFYYIVVFLFRMNLWSVEHFLTIFVITFGWVRCCFAVAPTQKWWQKWPRNVQLIRVAFGKK